ncbi:hypothetical protein KEM55_001943 [Ascosphaera atra]|nr:hypothetical protein KEM55_007369 [Ascosphaera atra]KAI5310009.1 hypothetical protein KEM55_001943 [Ascosphaera atra]
MSNPVLNFIRRKLSGGNLEVFKFGCYVMFPIGFMYYFGTNLDERFSVTDFWPTKEQSHQIPFELDEIDEELKRLDRKKKFQAALRKEQEALDAKMAENQRLLEQQHQPQPQHPHPQL